MDFDYKETTAVMRRIVATSSLQSGVKRLIDYCEKVDGIRTLARQLSKLPYRKDAHDIAAQLEQFAKEKKIPAACKGFYIGLDGLNMPDGHGLQFGCSPHADDSDDAEWASECDTYPGDLMSPLLSEIYRRIDGASVWDYALTLGYCGLALRFAFEKIDSRLLLNGQKARHVCWGHHDGDLLYLGTLSPRGFKPFRPAPQLKKKNLKSVKRTFQKASGPIHWIQRAEQAALQNPNSEHRCAQLLSLADLYAEVGAWDAVNRVLHDVDALRKAGVDLTDAYSLHSSSIIQKHWQSRGESPIPDISWYFGDVEMNAWDDRPIRTPAELDLLKRLQAVVMSGDKKILRREIPKLAREHASLVKKLGDSTRFYQTRKLLMQAYLMLKDIGKANKIAESGEALYYEYASLCFKSDLPASFLSQLEDQELEGAISNLPNLHHAGSSFGKIAKLYAEAGATKRYASIVKRALAHIPKAMKVSCQPWQVVSVFCNLAPAAHIAKDLEGFTYFAAQAEEWAEIQAKSKGSLDSVSSTWVSIADMYAKIGEYEKAIVAAKRIPKKRTRQYILTRYYAHLNRHEEIEAELRKCQTVGRKVDFLESIARSLIP